MSPYSLNYLVICCIVYCTSADGAVQFDDFLSLFENCTVKLYNYRNVQLQITNTPVSIITYLPFQLEEEHKIRTRIPFHCLALFYILPQRSLNPSNKFRKPAKKGPGKDVWSFRESENLLDTKTRYDILVDDRGGMTREWGMEYMLLHRFGVSSYGIIINITKWDFVNQNLRDAMMVVSRLKLAQRKFVTSTVHMSNVLPGNNRANLDKRVEDVNDVRNNWDVAWDVGLHDNFEIRMMQHAQFRSAHYLLTPDSITKEGRENYLFALAALGRNVSIVDWYLLSRPELKGSYPTIKYNVVNGEIMREAKPRRFGFISCAIDLGPDVYRYSFSDVFKQFTRAFHPCVYMWLALTYLGPCLVFGMLYHCILKQKIQRKYWLKWDPFTWGIRALIWQAGDRRWSDKRFGFMTWVVTPSMLVAVVISYTFRGLSIGVLNRASYFQISRSWTSLGSLRWAGVTLVTDNLMLAHYSKIERFVRMIRYDDIADVVARNWSIAYVTDEDRAAAVANSMVGWSGWYKGRCRSWRKVKRGSVRYYDVYDLLNMRGLDGWNLIENLKINGWRLENWGDIRVIRRMKWLEGPSGIVQKWRDVIKKQIQGKDVDDIVFRYIGSVGLSGNIKWVFVVGIVSMWIWFGVWLGEWVLWHVYTKPNRKRLARRMKDRDVGGEMIREEMGGNEENVEEGSANNDEGKLATEPRVQEVDAELVVKALGLQDNEDGLFDSEDTQNMHDNQLAGGSMKTSVKTGWDDLGEKGYIVKEVRANMEIVNENRATADDGDVNAMINEILDGGMQNGSNKETEQDTSGIGNTESDAFSDILDGSESKGSSSGAPSIPDNDLIEAVTV